MEADKRLLSYRDLMERTGLSRSTLIRAKQHGQLACYRVGSRTLFGESHLTDYLLAREVKAKDEGEHSGKDGAR